VLICLAALTEGALGGPNDGDGDSYKACKASTECQANEFCMVLADKPNEFGCAPCRECHHDTDSVEKKCPQQCTEAAEEGRKEFQEKEKDAQAEKEYEAMAKERDEEERARGERLKDGKPNEQDLKNADEAFKLLAPCKAHTDCEHKEFCHVVNKPGSSEVMGSGCAKCGQCQAEQDGVGKECFQKCGHGESPSRKCAAHTDCGHGWFCTSNPSGDDGKPMCVPCGECHFDGDAVDDKCPEDCKWAMHQGEEL
jgi:hypothetical protein